MNTTKLCYEAEQELEFILDNGGTVDFYGSMLTVPQEAKFGDIDSVQRYVNTVCEYLGIKDPPAVRRRRGDAKAHYEYDTRTIAVPEHMGSRNSWAMRESLVLHELAHHLTHGGHGSDFCSAMVWLVRRCIGPEAGTILAAAYGERGINIYSYDVHLKKNRV